MSACTSFPVARAALILALALVGIAPAAPAMEHAATPLTPRAPLFKNLGKYHRATTTGSVMAQRYFDQGMNLLWAFNLEEAQRSFEEMARLDTTSAAAWWGVAMSLGPHINLPALPDRTQAANGAAQKALALAGNASPVERALIEALVKRYADPAPTDPAAQALLDQAYADALRGVAQRFPADDDVQALYVEALMDLHPWDYWKDGRPQPWTPEITTLLEKLQARNPGHPGVNHYYIHAVEASPNPEKALAAAQRLDGSMPDNGHMVHMPSHIYQRLGMYQTSEGTNRKAVSVDQDYFASARPTGFMNTMYAAHNIHFVSYAAMNQGRSAEALRHARNTATFVPAELLRAIPGLEIFGTVGYMAEVRFAKWDDVLAEPRPAAGLPFVAAVWHYARGRALTAQGRPDEAAVELDSVRAIAAATPPESQQALNSTRDLLTIAENELAGAIAAKQGDYDTAIPLLEKAAATDRSLRYDEPWDWMVPASHMLGATLLDAGRATEAEKVYRADLEIHPGSGWALVGLAQSLRAQKRDAEAAVAERDFQKSWVRADLKITRSAL